jgi:Uma2 family endonuclease
MVIPQTHPRRRYSIDEYVRIAEPSTEKLEYHDGEILAKSGGSFEHSLIVSNINGEIRSRLKGKPYRAVDSNLRIATPKRSFYPDGSVICGPPEFDPRDKTGQSATNPKVIIEVLSPTTENYDRTEKFDHYRDLPSLQEYILVLQNSARVETYIRTPEGPWIFTPFIGLEAIVKIHAIQIEVPLTEIYANVTFPAPNDPPEDRDRT